MSEQLHVMKILVLFLISICSEAIHLDCNSACERIEGAVRFQTNQMCCFEKDKKLFTKGIPPRKAHLFAEWYVYEEQKENLVALNITWFDRSSTVFTNESDGYTLQITRTSSFATDTLIFRINKEGYAKKQDEMVGMSYLLFGRNNATILDMERSYLVLMESLPFPSDLKIQGETSDVIVALPDCTDGRVSHTLNCKQEEETPDYKWYPDVDDSTMYFDDILPDPTTPSLTKKKILNESHPAILVSASVLITALVLCSLFSLYHTYAKYKAPLPQRKLFVVISSKECNNESAYSRAGNELCCCLREIGMEVVFTMWNLTEMGTTDSIKWVNENVAKADHVIVIQKSVSRNVKPKKQNYQWCSENETLLNPTFDPYHIVCQLIRIGSESKSKFSAVHFHKEQRKRLENRADSYLLPENVSGLLQKITGRRLIRGSLKEKFEGKLSDITQKIRSNAELRNGAEGSIAQLKSLPKTEIIIFNEEQPDSGYLTR